MAKSPISKRSPDSKSSDPSPKLIFDANMDAALRKYYKRTESQMVCTEMPFDALLRSEEERSHDSDEIDEDTIMRIRAGGIKLLFRYLLAEGEHPLKLMKRLFAVGRGLDIAPFNALTMDEAGMLFSETKAAHSWRMKVLSGIIVLSGQKGSRLPGQKSPNGTLNYRAAQMGNTNRAKGKKQRLPKEEKL